ncbi:hypothetical protein STEG23_006087, partial [Scotinomys teguina]
RELSLAVLILATLMRKAFSCANEFKAIPHFLFCQDLYHIHKGYFKALACATTMLRFSVPSVVELLGSSGDILSFKM